MKKSLAILALSLSISAYGQDGCDLHYQVPKGQIHFPKIYSKMDQNISEGKHIQYGFETEYIEEEAEILLAVYMPDASVAPNLTREKWLQMTVDERHHFMEANKQSIFPDYREPGKMVRITDDKELFHALPESIVYDAGHYELVLPPSNTVEEISSKIKNINKKLGIGSMQVTVSVPHEAYFALSPKPQFSSWPMLSAFMPKTISPQDIKISVGENLGYLNFLNDMDTLEKMKTGFERYMKDNSQLTAKSFAHPWLGPMNSNRHQKLTQLITDHSTGVKQSPEQLKKIAVQIDSHKFISGTVYRPDVAAKYKRIAHEIRDCHKNPACLEDHLKRELFFNMKGKEKFSKASEFKQFDWNKDFFSLDTEVQGMLKNLFPKYGSYGIDSTEVFRNFAWPLRDWSKHAEFFENPALLNSIKSSQEKYVSTLKNIQKGFKEGVLTKEQAKAQIQGELNRFSVESGLYDAFMKHYENLLDQDYEKLDFIKFTLLRMELNYVA
jgi:hypothetical protein